MRRSTPRGAGAAVPCPTWRKIITILLGLTPTLPGALRTGWRYAVERVYSFACATGVRAALSWVGKLVAELSKRVWYRFARGGGCSIIGMSIRGRIRARADGRFVARRGGSRLVSCLPPTKSGFSSLLLTRCPRHRARRRLGRGLGRSGWRYRLPGLRCGGFTLRTRPHMLEGLPGIPPCFDGVLARLLLGSRSRTGREVAILMRTRRRRVPSRAVLASSSRRGREVFACVRPRVALDARCARKA